MTLTQQWLYLNLITYQKQLSPLISYRGIVGYRQIISSRLYVLLKGTCPRADRALSNTYELTR